jgi:hypothetical protein
MKRRAFLAVGLVATAAGLPSRAALASTKVQVYKNPACGCCGGWVQHLRSNGFSVEVHEVEDVSPMRARAGIPDAIASCHAAFVEGYALEGHVPAAEIKRLLAERPAAKALVVPGMEQTPPGMGAEHGKGWDVLLLASDGTTRVYRSYPAK